MPSPNARARAPSRLDRCLRIFTDVRAGEGVTGVVMFANVFLILCAYYFVKPLRESWIAVSDVSGLTKMEVKAYSSFAQSLLLVAVVSNYARLAGRWPRAQLITRATIFCMSNLVVFWLLQPGFILDHLPLAGILFYLWVGMFGVFVVSQFWAFAADLYADEQGRRLLPMIAIGATAGAAFGAYLTSALVRSELVDSGTLLLGATVPLAVSIALTRWADTRGPAGTGADRQPETATTSAPGTAAGPAAADAGTPAPRGRLDTVWLVLRHSYLLPVAVATMLTNWVNTNGENLLFRVVQQVLADRMTERGITDPDAVIAFVREGTAAFYGDFFFWVNLSALVLQALVASRLLRYGGFGITLLLLPSIALVSYSCMALFPVLAMVKFMKVAENSTDYSINNTARHVLWLPTATALKYMAKPTIETLFVRLGDGLAALTVLFGVQIWALSTRAFFAVNVTLVVAWLAVSIPIVREHRRLSAAR